MLSTTSTLRSAQTFFMINNNERLVYLSVCLPIFMYNVHGAGTRWY